MVSSNVLANHAAQHLAQFVYNLIQIEDLWLQNLFATERQQLSRQRGRPVRRLADLLRAPAQRIFRPHPPEHQLAVAEDGGQDVVEIVRDAPGQTTDGLDLLGLPQLLLQGRFAFLTQVAVEQNSCRPREDFKVVLVRVGVFVRAIGHTDHADHLRYVQNRHAQESPHQHGVLRQFFVRRRIRGGCIADHGPSIRDDAAERVFQMAETASVHPTSPFPRCLQRTAGEFCDPSRRPGGRAPATGSFFHHGDEPTLALGLRQGIAEQDLAR